MGITKCRTDEKIKEMLEGLANDERKQWNEKESELQKRFGDLIDTTVLLITNCWKADIKRKKIKCRENIICESNNVFAIDDRTGELIFLAEDKNLDLKEYKGYKFKTRTESQFFVSSVVQALPKDTVCDSNYYHMYFSDETGIARWLYSFKIEITFNK